MDKSFNSVPFWKVICGSILNLLLLLLISSLIYAVWIISGLPDFSSLWIIFIIITSVLLSVIKRRYGRTLGDAILRINPSENQTNKATLWTYGIFWGIAIAIIAIANIFKSDSRVSENDYYAITIPNGWNAHQITERNPLLYCVALEKDSNKGVSFCTVNYNTTGISLESLTAMILGGFSRSNTQDIEVKDIEFQACKAVRVDGTLNGIQTKTIIFLSPSGKLSYILGSNLNDQEFESLLSGVHLKNTHSPYADFDACWKSFYGDNLECNIYQKIEDGLYLEGWKYDKTNDVVSMNILFETDAITIQDFFKNSENKDYFTSEICRHSEVMTKVANNYNKTLLITIKDADGKPILSLPIDPNDLDPSQE